MNEAAELLYVVQQSLLLKSDVHEVKYQEMLSD